MASLHEDDDQAAEIEEDEDEKCPAVRFHLLDEAEALIVRNALGFLVREHGQLATGQGAGEGLAVVEQDGLVVVGKVDGCRSTWSDGYRALLTRQMHDCVAGGDGGGGLRQ
jgi:hypothetical protein